MSNQKNKQINKRPKELKTRKAIMDILKQEGAQDSKTLAERLGVTAMAVRQHLYALQEEKLLVYTEVARPKGRPAKMWELTPAANRFFPDGNSALLVDMIGLIDTVLGDNALASLITKRADQQFSAYQLRLEEALSLHDKLTMIAEIRTEEGYMADVEEKADGSYLLIENHCPICAAATACQNFCSAEQTLFQKLLQNDAQIERIEYILEGNRRCVYEVKPLSKKAITSP